MSAGKLITVLKPDRKAIWKSIKICFCIAILSVILSLIQSFLFTKEININLFDIPQDNTFHKNIAAFILLIFSSGISIGLIMTGSLIATFTKYYDIYIYENGFEYQDSGFQCWSDAEFDLRIPDHENIYLPCCHYVIKSEKPVFFLQLNYEGIDYTKRNFWTGSMEALRDYLNEQKSKYQNSHS